MALTPAEVQKNLHKLAPFSQERIEQLHDIERQAFASFTGQFDELEAALGMLHLGDHLGWKPLVLIHNKRTIRKYEEILGINIREFFDAEKGQVQIAPLAIPSPRRSATSGRPSAARSRATN